MLELYHYPFSTCSQKVRLVLAEKSLDFESREVNLLAGEQHEPEYVKLNPNHVVPTLVHDGAVLIESTLINEYIDEVFPDTPMRPADPRARHAVRLWTKRLDEKVHPAIFVVTFTLGHRSLLIQQPEEAREANIQALPDPDQRKIRRSLLERGADAPEFAGAVKRLVDMLDVAEASLASGSPWLSGDVFGLADAGVLPYVLRMDHLAMTPLFSREARPALADWYDRVQARPSYETAVSKWSDEGVVALLRANGGAVWPQVAAVAAGA